MSTIDCHGIAAFDFANYCGCSKLIKESTNNFGNCLNLLLIDVPGLEDPLVDSPLSNFDHSSCSFFVKMDLKIPNITFCRKMYLKSRVDWPRFGEDLCNFN